MSLRDFCLFVVICLVWAFNTVAAKIVVTDMHVPPLFFGMLRSAVIALAVLPWLLPMPRPHWRIVVVGILMGGGGFALFFVGLKTASPSAASIVGQIGVPFATLLSVLVLGERIRWKRGIGIALTLMGVLLVMFDPEGFDVSVGLLFVVASAFGGAVGTIMMKQMEGIRPLRFQAWVGFSSTLSAGAALRRLRGEPSRRGLSGRMAARGRWCSIPALVVSVLGHTAYYGLIQRYEANLVAPLTLMSPLMTIVLGIWITGDHFDARMALGTALALLGVFIIAIRPNVTLGDEDALPQPGLAEPGRQRAGQMRVARALDDAQVRAVFARRPGQLPRKALAVGPWPEAARDVDVAAVAEMHEARAPGIGEEHGAADADGRIVRAADDDRGEGEPFERHRREARDRARRARAVVDVGRRDEERAADQEVGPALGEMRDERAGEAVGDEERAGRAVDLGGDLFEPSLEVRGVPVVLRDEAGLRR